MKKFLFLFIIVFFGVLFSFPFTYTYAQEDNQQLEGFNLVGYSEGGDKAWDVKGATATIENNEINITDVDANSYGDEDMNVTAKKGRIDKEQGDMRLEQDVVLTTETGTKMLTDTLDWQKQKDLVTTQDDVTILRDNMKAVGKGITAHPGLNKAQLNQDVVVEYKPTADDPLKDMITISSDGPMEVDYLGQTAIFHDNVIALQGDRKLMADQMQIYFDADKKQIKEMVCTGNVLIVQGQNTSFSDKAVYLAGEQKIKLYGRPKLLLYMDDKDKKDTHVPFGS
jgi:LPS export ABC transporter protein LptC/lipopolysaccharide transport protein LptA